MNDELTKHTLNLFAGDYGRIQQLYPDIGAGPVIRRLIRDFLSKVDEAVEPQDIDVTVKI